MRAAGTAPTRWFVVDTHIINVIGVADAGEDAKFATVAHNINRASRRLRGLARPVRVMGPSTFFEWLANNEIPDARS